MSGVRVVKRMGLRSIRIHRRKKEEESRKRRKEKKENNKGAETNEPLACGAAGLFEIQNEDAGSAPGSKINW